MQVHYNNEAQTANLVDRSGVKMKLTATLREHDAGFLQVGRDRFEDC